MLSKILGRNRTTNKKYSKLSYISAEDTVQSAAQEDLSVCDYVEKLWDQQGQTVDTISKIINFLQLVKKPTILEIGTGTGRYLEKTLERIDVGKYESYEIAEDWNQYLKKRYPNISVYDATGSSLIQTASASIDLVMAHGVFVYLPFLASMSYFKEIIRVIKPSGYCVFDCLTEMSFKFDDIERWLLSNHQYPVILPEQLIKDYFIQNGFEYINGFSTKYGQSNSQYFIFRKK